MMEAQEDDDVSLDLTSETIYGAGARCCGECRVWHGSGALHVCPVSKRGNWIPENVLELYEFDGVEEAGDVIVFRRRRG